MINIKKRIIKDVAKVLSLEDVVEVLIKTDIYYFKSIYLKGEILHFTSLQPFSEKTINKLKTNLESKLKNTFDIGTIKFDALDMDELRISIRLTPKKNV